MDSDKLKADLAQMGIDLEQQPHTIKPIIGAIRKYASYTSNYELGQAAGDYMLELDLSISPQDCAPSKS